MLQDIEDSALLFNGKRQSEVSLRATHGERTCRKLVLDWDGHRVQARDLVLEPGVVGRVVARWGGGQPAAGATLKVSLHDQKSTSDDERESTHYFEGVTDEQGELAFGPVLDLEYWIVVSVSHPEGPPHEEWWDSRVLRGQPLELTMPRGRTVRGQLLTTDGRAAAGYRVGPWSPKQGDPEQSRVVLTDAEGWFTVAGVGLEVGAGIGVYDKPVPPSPDPEEHSAHLSDTIGSLVNPLLVHEVAVGGDDLGRVLLPKLGTFTVRWTRPDKSHGARGHHIDADGIVRVHRIPLGIAVNLSVTIQDSQYGELQQRFRIAEVKEETVTLHVTGAGTVVIRLHAADSPQEPLVARFINVHWHQYSGGWEDGPTSELRWWVPPGLYRLTIKAKGFRERILKKIHVRDDGPTFLDVELEPR
jgi:hypothetical protein